jgi:hypothetical protein
VSTLTEPHLTEPVASLAAPVGRALDREPCVRKSRMRGACLATLGLVSCSHDFIEGEQLTTVRFGTLPVAIAVGSTVLLAAVAAVLLLRPVSRVKGVVALVCALLAGIVTAMVVTAEIKVTADEIHDYRGFPWSRTKRGFRFDEVQAVTIFERRVRSGRTTSTEHVWSLQRLDGTWEEMIVGDLWADAEGDLIDLLVRRGVTFSTGYPGLQQLARDPFAAEFAGERRRIDAAGATERISALVFGGHLLDLTHEETGDTLRAALSSGGPLPGRWSSTLTGLGRSVELRVDMDADGRFVYEVQEADSIQRAEGTYRLTDHELVLEHGGSTTSVLLPRE